MWPTGGKGGLFSSQRREDLQSSTTAELDELKRKRGAGVWYTARDDDDEG